jgi:Phage tail lysozyme
VRSAASPHPKNRTAKRAGRHRAPSRYPRTIKIIGGALVALLGAFAAHQAQLQQPGHVTSGTAAYGRHTPPLADKMADGSADARTMRPASGGKSNDSSRSRQTAKDTKPRQRAKVKSARRASATGITHAPSTTRQGGTSTRSRHSPGSSTANLRSAVQRDIANGNYLLAVGQYMVEHGYSRAAAAGIAGCVDGESAGNPESVGSGGGGLIGWTPISSAQPNPNILTGNAAQDMRTQLADILYYNSTEIGQSWVNQLNNISDPVAAADFYSLNFEKPAVTYSDVRPPMAQQIFSELGGL